MVIYGDLINIFAILITTFLVSATRKGLFFPIYRDSTTTGWCFDIFSIGRLKRVALSKESRFTHGVWSGATPGDGPTQEDQGRSDCAKEKKPQLIH